MITRKQIKELVLEIINAADYDIGKSFDPETAEEPDYAAKKLEAIINMAEKKLKKFEKKQK